MTPHPAPFTDALLPILAELLPESPVPSEDGGSGPGTLRVLDPFAGTGKIARLRAWFPQAEFYGYEIEPEWAEQARANGLCVTTGDSRQMHYPDAMFDAICTSPTYGNRMADHHEALRIAAAHVPARARPAADARELRGDGIAGDAMGDRVLRTTRHRLVGVPARAQARRNLRAQRKGSRQEGACCQRSPTGTR